MEDVRFQNRPVNPLDERKQSGSKKSFLGSIYGRIALILFNGTSDKAALAESDGKLTASLYGKAGSTSTAIAVETTGEQKEVNYGKAGATVTAFSVETAGEQKIVGYSKKSDATVTAHRVDAAGFQRMREFEPFEATAVVAIQTTATTIYTVPASTVAVVEIEITNTDTVANSYDFHIVPSGGAAAIGNRMASAHIINAATVPDRYGPYHVGPGVFFQALVTTVGSANGDLNAIAIVREYGTGDAVALV